MSVTGLGGSGGAATVAPDGGTTTDTGGAGSGTSTVGTVDRTGPSDRARIAASLEGTRVVTNIRVAPDAISYVEGALASLGSAEATAARRVLREACELDGNRVLTLDEAKSVLEPALSALPDGGAAVRAALAAVDGDLDAERAHEADLRDGVEVLFNSERDAPSLSGRIVEELDQAVARAAGRPLDVHIMIFSFTDQAIAAKLEEIARANPNVHVRVLADWSALATSGPSKPPRLADLRLPNLSVRFKKDNPYRWSDSAGRAVYDHARSLGLNHHKGLVTLIDGKPDKLLSGSFNWSPTADNQNFENLMVLDSEAAANRTVMRHFGAEFEAMWNDGGVSLTHGEARDHKRILYRELERAAGGASVEVKGLERGAGDSIARLGPDDVVDLNGWANGAAIAALCGGGADGADVARAMQAERLAFGRFTDLDDLIARIPAVGLLAPDVLDALRRDAAFGDGRVEVNAATAEELQAIGLPADTARALVERRGERGDIESLEALRDLPGMTAPLFRRVSRHLSDDSHRVSFSARAPHEADGDSGYAAVNESKTVPVLGADGVVRMESATLGAGAVDMIRRAEPGETLKLATYGLSTTTPEYAALAAAARRGVKVQVVLNQAYNEAAAAALEALRTQEGLSVDVRVSRRTMHEKFLVHPEGQDAFNGSANLSGSSSRKNSEDRFFFKNNPAIAKAFEAEFDRLWARLG